MTTSNEDIFRHALESLQAGRFSDAERLFKEVLHHHPEHVASLNLLSVVLTTFERYSEAEIYLKAALKLNASSDSAFYNYGIILKQLNRPNEALEAFNQALLINPSVAEIWNNRGTVFNDMQRYEDAISDFNKAISLNQFYAEAFYNKAKSLAELKRHDEALTTNDKALSLKPRFALGWLGRGNILNELKRHAEALTVFDKALALKPDLAEAWLGRGNVFDELKRYDDALAAYDKALSLTPDLAEAWLGRGNVFNELKRYDEALAAYDQALALKPRLEGAWLGRGNVFTDLERHDEALSAYMTALSLKADFAEAWLGRGNIFNKLKRYDEALAAYDQALALKPKLGGAWLGRGNVFNELKRHEEALSAYDTALSFKSNFAEAWLGRGNVLNELKRCDEALAAYDMALSLKSDFAEAWLGRGNVFNELKRYDNSFAAYDRALVLKPNLVEAQGARLHAMMHCCNWANFESDCKQLISSVRSKKLATPPFPFLAICPSSQDLADYTKLWVAKQHPQLIDAISYYDVRKREKIHIGYVSADFHEHATSFLLAGMLECHDKSRFEITAISVGPNDESDMRRRLKCSFDNFIDARALTDEEAAFQIKRAEIDILVDLKGFTQDARPNIFARRPCPMQVNYLGYPGTMGASYIDYIIADEVVIPKSQRQHYTEKIIYLPNSYQANDRNRHISDKTFTRPELGLPPHGFVFCCFNNSYKITPHVFDCWMRILKQAEGGVMWLLSDGTTAEDNLRREATARGVDSGRLVFAERIPPAEHLARHRHADLFLDTLPYNAHTTASDALWAGLPVLTCVGETFSSRVAASLLTAIRLPELVTSTPEGYEQMAVDLATRPEKMMNIKRRLDKNRLTTPLFDTKLFTIHIEAAYIAMYERRQAGLAPDHIFISN